MPTYDYVCQACGHAFEQFQEMSAKKLRTCPACGKRALERQVGAGAGLIFKGTGFYITDYRKPAPAGASGAEGAPAAGSPPANPAAGAGAGATSGSGKDGAGASSPKPAGSAASSAAPGGSSAGSGAAAPAKGSTGRTGKGGSSR